MLARAHFLIGYNAKNSIRHIGWEAAKIGEATGRKSPASEVESLVIVNQSAKLLFLQSLVQLAIGESVGVGLVEQNLR